MLYKTTALALGMLAGEVANAQVVQLPSIRNFSYSGGALVPDAGTAPLAGNSYANSGTDSRGWGPYGTRASGSTLGSSFSSASAQIFDLRALDEAILSSNVANPAKNANPSKNARAISPTGRSVVGSIPPTGVAPRIDPGKWQRVLAGGQPTVQVHTALAESDIRFYLKKGQEAEAANRIMAARVYNRMAVEAMTPEMKSRYEKIMTERETALKAEATVAAAAANANGRQRF